MMGEMFGLAPSDRQASASQTEISRTEVVRTRQNGPRAKNLSMEVVRKQLIY